MQLVWNRWLGVLAATVLMFLYAVAPAQMQRPQAAGTGTLAGSVLDQAGSGSGRHR